jgi:uncharacterized membrane protein YphA (DoxX/SURF4 family)
MLELSWFHPPYVLLLARLILGSIFAVAGMAKLRHPRVFVSTVVGYHILPIRWARRVALILPWLEVWLGCTLLLGIGLRAGAVSSGLLLSLFTGAVSINVIRGRKDLDCGCLGAQHRQKIGGGILVRNAGLILLALPLAWWGGDDPVITRWLTQGLAFGLTQFVLVDQGLPFTLTAGGIPMLVLLIRQLHRYVQREAQS